MYKLIIKNVKLKDRDDLTNIFIKDKKIEKISEFNGEKAKKIIDADSKFTIPPFVDSHVHLDTALTAGEPKWNKSGTLFEGIERWAERKEMLSEKDVIARAKKALSWQIANGVLSVRTHVDICDPKLTALKAMFKVKQWASPYLNLQIVAFPQEGILSYNDGKELLEQSLKMGADVVGGIPHFEYTREYGVKSVKIIFDLAEKYNKLIDIHCDEIDDEQSRFVEVAAAEAIKRDMGKITTVSHTTAMHSYNGAYTSKLLRFCKKAGINFIANPLVNIHLQGRFDDYPKRRGITRVKEINKMGINLSFGHDDILDPWYPLGTGSMLQVAHMGAHITQMMGIEELKEIFKMITKNGAKTLNISSNYDVREGNDANLLILPADNQLDALRRQTAPKWVISRGNIVAENDPINTNVILESKKKQINFKK